VWCALVKVEEKEADLSIRQIGVNKNKILMKMIPEFKFAEQDIKKH